MTKKSDAPAIRFKGFSDAWEQRKLGDIGKARSGVGFPDADQGGVTGVPFFKVSDMNLDGNENEMIVANNYVTAEQIADHRWSPITELPAIFFAKVGAAVMLIASVYAVFRSFWTTTQWHILSVQRSGTQTLQRLCLERLI